jgi:hypothetical protein
MEPQDFLQGIFRSYPMLAVIGPLVGVIMARIKNLGKVQGFGLLGIAFLVTLIVTATYGYAESWTVETWHKAPFAVVVTLAVSQLTSQTTLHAQDTIARVKDKLNGNGDG